MKRYPGLKKGSEDFDAPVGRLDGFKMCELVETSILNKLKNVSQNNMFGLHRDGTIYLVWKLRNWRRLLEYFKDCGLNNTIIGKEVYINYVGGDGWRFLQIFQKKFYSSGDHRSKYFMT